jgi:hypothetical protein
MFDLPFLKYDQTRNPGNGQMIHSIPGYSRGRGCIKKSRPEDQIISENIFPPLLKRYSSLIISLPAPTQNSLGVFNYCLIPDTNIKDWPYLAHFGFLTLYLGV